MPGMSQAWHDAQAEAGAARVTHIGLVDGTGTELSEGDPAYSRKAVGWTEATSGKCSLDGDYVFDIPAGATVAGWRGFDALTVGNNLGGKDHAASEVYAGQGTFTLKASETSITSQNPAT